MSNNKKLFGIIVLGAIIGYVGLMIIKSYDPKSKQLNPVNEDDPFDTTELTNSYIYDHSKIK